ncbi:hypothetical protein [Tumebacillus permanentifrigoris]|uniref:Uncharacterized protein n=1 Tax=Tumebacillus permanentifrigoris TaxID=378543 RepID=A0A316D8U8_9BACL|nr:hypothetical protein [Tumebacillus permanentifrigoris]PWK11495.1 hypothetical protein C7459_11024 [Tumebacillus permanentifrigoris]
MSLEQQIHLTYHVCYSSYLREQIRQGKTDAFPYPITEVELGLLEQTNLDRLEMIGDNHTLQMVKKWRDRLFPLTISQLLTTRSLQELVDDYLAYSRMTPVGPRMDVDISPARFAQYVLKREGADPILCELFIHELLAAAISGTQKELQYAPVELEYGALQDKVFIKAYTVNVNKGKDLLEQVAGEQPTYMLYLNLGGKALKTPLRETFARNFIDAGHRYEPEELYAMLTQKK